MTANLKELCSDCPPIGYLTDNTRCLPCPRRAATVLSQMEPPAPQSGGGPVGVPRAWIEELARYRVADARGSWDVPGFDACVTAEVAHMFATSPQPLDDVTEIIKEFGSRDLSDHSPDYAEGYRNAVFDIELALRTSRPASKEET